MDRQVSPAEYARLEKQYNELFQRFASLQDAFAELNLKKQEAELTSRRVEFMFQQLTKEREELILEKIDIRTALEELRAAQNEVLDKNIQLQQAYLEITNQKTALQAAHDQLNTKNSELVMRGIELRTAMEELKMASEQLLINEKMSALGHVISNIAHEINNPIGAIYAASQNVSGSLPNLLSSFPTLFKEMADKVRPLFFELVEMAKQNQHNFDPRDERQHRKVILEELTALKVPGAEGVARSLVKIGMLNNFEHFLPIFLDPLGEHMVDAALAVGRLKANIETIATAVGKTQKTILALKSYTDDDLTPQRTGTIDVVSNVEEVVRYYRELHRPGLEIITNYDSDVPIISCYPDQLKQVWNNLVLNAVQAMPQGGTLTVSILKDPDAGQITISVSDTGPGISDKYRGRVFEPFFTTRAEGEGSGLGLYVSKKIVNRHNGSIELSTKPGLTTFIVHLPVHLKHGA